MLTLHAAATLLAADDPDALGRLAAACGCDGPPHALSPLDQERLGLGILGNDPDGLTVRVARGAGCLRALLIDCASGIRCGPFRDVLPRLAARMARRTPHIAWLCIASSHDTGRPLALASWSGDRIPPRVAALSLDRDDIVDSDAETLCALAAAASSDDTLTHSRWLSILGRDALTQRFYHALVHAVGRLGDTMVVPAGRRITDANRRSLALVCTSRLLFLAFLEAKGWLDGDRGFLGRTYTECVGGAGRYYVRVLRPLFFGTLNTPIRRRAPRAKAFGRIPFLNGGLFAPTPLEQRARAELSDEAIGALFGEVLERYRFTAHEDRRTWSEAAVDPEMLGKAFESLMEPRERQVTGAFYTPQPLVERVGREALAHMLASPVLSPADADALLRGGPGTALPSTALDAVRARIRRVRVIDPACGSGAFLVYSLEALATIAAHAGDMRPVSDRRRAVLTRSIFGVDINPIAVWLCELRLWLSVVIETSECDPSNISPLPNLDHNVRVGDALAGGGFRDRGGSARSADPAATSRAGRRLASLRERYAHSTGPRKRQLVAVLDRTERLRAIAAVERELVSTVHTRREALAIARSRDLFGAPTSRGAGDRAQRCQLRVKVRLLRARLRALRDGAALPFMFAAHFADADAAGGFDVVLGNPPWVRPHAVPIADRTRLAREFRVSRHAAWIPRCVPRPRSAAFGAQVDLAALFVERAVSLASDGGTIALLLPAKLWRCLAGGGVRRLLAGETSLRSIEDWSAARPAFDAAVYPSLLVASKGSTQPERDATMTPAPGARQ